MYTPIAPRDTGEITYALKGLIYIFNTRGALQSNTVDSEIFART